MKNYKSTILIGLGLITLMVACKKSETFPVDKVSIQYVFDPRDSAGTNAYSYRLPPGTTTSFELRMYKPTKTSQLCGIFISNLLRLCLIPISVLPANRFTRTVYMLKHSPMCHQPLDESLRYASLTLSTTK